MLFVSCLNKDTLIRKKQSYDVLGLTDDDDCKMYWRPGNNFCFNDCTFEIQLEN